MHNIEVIIVAKWSAYVPNDPSSNPADVNITFYYRL